MAKKQKNENEIQPKLKSQMPWLLILGIILIVVGTYFGYLYSTTVKMIYVVPSVIGWGGGGFSIYFWKKKKEQITEDIIIPGRNMSQGPVNSMNIYPPEKGGVIFENTYQPEGQPKRCVNNGRIYFVNIWDVTTKKLKPFTLPDQQYYDPRVFAERVLELPAHRKLFTRKQNLLQKFSPFILMLVMIIIWIAMITTTSPVKGA